MPKRDRRGHRMMILRRRELVARLRARGMSLREITETLAQDPTYRHPRTGRPYSMIQVLRDIRWIEEQWRAQALEHIEAHKARVLAEIAELKRQGWLSKDLPTLVKALARECAVLGLDAPAKVEGAVEPVRVIVSYEDEPEDIRGDGSAGVDGEEAE